MSPLHHGVYGATRAQFGRGARLAGCAWDRVAEAVRAARLTHNDRCPSLRSDTNSRYDARTYRLRQRDPVSLDTLDGRLVCQPDPGNFSWQYHYGLTWTIRSTEALRRNAVW